MKPPIHRTPLSQYYIYLFGFSFPNLTIETILLDLNVRTNGNILLLRSFNLFRISYNAYKYYNIHYIPKAIYSFTLFHIVYYICFVFTFNTKYIYFSVGWVFQSNFILKCDHVFIIPFESLFVI